MKPCIVIPARFASSRFPGKPLALIDGKPMIARVADQCAKALATEDIFIATDDTRIASLVRDYGYQAIMTSSNCETGTDRVAEAIDQLSHDLIINVQGDEPLVNPMDILRCLDLKRRNPNAVVNGFSYSSKASDYTNPNVPKVVTNENGKLLYMSRSPIPGYKSNSAKPARCKKQVCIYGFSREQLSDFAVYGGKSLLEGHEDIEILRFLELDHEIQMFECDSNTVAVDVPEDIIVVETMIKQKNA